MKYKKTRKYSEIFLTIGGSDGDRTHYLLTASQTLSQMSYAPVQIQSYFREDLLSSKMSTFPLNLTKPINKTDDEEKRNTVVNGLGF